MHRPILLEVRDLKLKLSDAGVNANVQNAMNILKGVSFNLSPGSSLSILGRTASGKSLLLRCITRMLQDVPVDQISGEILFEGDDLLTISEARLRAIRGQRIGTLLQDIHEEYNRQLTIAQHLQLLLKTNAPGIRNWREQVMEFLYRVGLVDPEDLLHQRIFPEEVDSATLQKITLAAALACEPDILILDEPVTEMDSRSRDRIARALDELKKERGLSVIMATGNLRWAEQFGDSVAVLNGGLLVEVNTPRQLFEEQTHPATRAFFDGTLSAGKERDRLIAHFYREP